MVADRLNGSDGLGPAGFTLPTLQATMFGNRNLTAEEGRAATVAMCTAAPTPTASDGRVVDARTACAALAGWNGRGDLDARGAVLWRKFVERLTSVRVDFWAVPFDPADPARTPRGFDASRPGFERAFADTVQAFDSAGVPVDLRLGDFQHHAGIPVHGCSSVPEGCFNQISLEPGGVSPDVSHGTTFVMAVELTRAGPRARTILTYGQSVDATSPHHTDQTRMYAAKQWVTGRYTEAEIAGDPTLTVRRLTAG
jgi:acyl-homoserine-lactone acylase